MRTTNCGSISKNCPRIHGWGDPEWPQFNPSDFKVNSGGHDPNMSRTKKLKLITSSSHLPTHVSAWFFVCTSIHPSVHPFLSPSNKCLLSVSDMWRTQNTLLSSDPTGQYWKVSIIRKPNKALRCALLGLTPDGMGNSAWTSCSYSPSSPSDLLITIWLLWGLFFRSKRAN